MKSKLIGLVSAGILAALALGLAGTTHGAGGDGAQRGDTGTVTLAVDNPIPGVIRA
ncbi:hypothetical protein GCM10009760_27880 [Kitasatospora kazusensis]|uniref:Uncharacterized protein n=1 Tax=Kitasatospora kazusensis TaxID=407974 RepID=A0ABN2ZI38_9ACTN